MSHTLSASRRPQHLQSLHDRQNVRTRADGVLYNLLKEVGGASEWSGAIRDVVSRKNEPSAHVAVTVDQSLDSLDIVPAFFQEVRRQLIEICLPDV